jgi:pyrimidine operon attenuation protein/uracil phosphoribosyltransferase
MEKKVLILDQKQIDRKLQRMAFEIWEQNSSEQEVTLIGIEGAGKVLAKNLAKRLKEIAPISVKLFTISLNKKSPLNEAIVLSEQSISNSVVLIDDVANSGKTLLYALKPLLDLQVLKITIAVLVDRKHKSFPIQPDIVGHSIATTLQNHIEVVCEDDEIVAAYLH